MALAKISFRPNNRQHNTSKLNSKKSNSSFKEVRRCIN